VFYFQGVENKLLMANFRRAGASLGVAAKPIFVRG
jgi:hypothetical protein